MTLKTTFFSILFFNFFISCSGGQYLSNPTTHKSTEYYYGYINSQHQKFLLSSDSSNLDQLYQEVLLWDNEIVSNCFFRILEEGQAYYLKTKQYDLLKKTFKKQSECGQRDGMLRYFQTNKEYQEFFRTQYGKDCIDSFYIWEVSFKKNLHITYLTKANYILANDEFARNFLYGDFENAMMGQKIGVFKNLSDSLNQEILMTLIRHTDSANFESLIRLYDLYGFPSSTKVGQGGLGFLYAHLFISCLPIYSSSGISSIGFIDSIMLKAVKNLEFNNRTYAFWKDNSTSPHSDACPNPYSIFGTPMNLGGNKKAILNPIQDIKNVDKRRAEIFLPPLWQDALIDNFPLPEGYPLPEEAKVYFKDR